MSDQNLHIVITTIAPPTPCVHKLHQKLSPQHRLVIVGDTKGPTAYELPNVIFLPYERQSSLNYKIYTQLPIKHYARKNLGYLYAMQQRAACIYETDDDNAPLNSWIPRSSSVTAAFAGHTIQSATTPAPWVNIYRYFTNDRNIWPRGLPLDRIVIPVPELIPGSTIYAPIQQGLVNNAPDVDAIWRLTQDRPFDFEQRESVVVPPGLWCPFNTQSTWWWPEVYPLLYVPSFCSFRMCDIWKSFVAQRCLWALNYGVVFHAPEVVQDRNYHNLNKDFEDEIPGYLGNQRLVDALAALALPPGRDNVAANLLRCYEKLIAEKFLPEKELALVHAWISDCERFTVRS